MKYDLISAIRHYDTDTRFRTSAMDILRKRSTNTYVFECSQERFRVEADVAVNRANMLTRLWKYAPAPVMESEYLLHAGVISMVEFDDDIFAAGNCYDENQYKGYRLFCPYAYRLPEGTILAKDLAVEYKYLSNTSEWFYIARKNAENVIRKNTQFRKGRFHYCLLHMRDVDEEEIDRGREPEGKSRGEKSNCGCTEGGYKMKKKEGKKKDEYEEEEKELKEQR